LNQIAYQFVHFTHTHTHAVALFYILLLLLIWHSYRRGNH